MADQPQQSYGGEIEKIQPLDNGFPEDRKGGFTSPTPTAREVPDFHDRTISTKDWAARTFDDVPGQIKEYVVSLFPIATWIYRYNLTWLTGDVSNSNSRQCVVRWTKGDI
jgi:hypothetical protein